MTLQKIAETLETSLTYEEAYAKHIEEKSWLADLINSAYAEMSDRMTSGEFVSFEDAVTVMDQAVLTVVTIYDTYLRELERNFANATP